VQNRSFAATANACITATAESVRTAQCAKKILYVVPTIDACITAAHVSVLIILFATRGGFAPAPSNASSVMTPEFVPMVIREKKTSSVLILKNAFQVTVRGSALTAVRFVTRAQCALGTRNAFLPTAPAFVLTGQSVKGIIFA
jgi:hypothetical protein